METKNNIQISKNFENKTVHISREFNAPLKSVWDAYTTSELLDQWWAPKPWKAETKTMKFVEGGIWLYAMVGPDGSKHWARMDFKKIDPYKNYIGEDAFADENGNVNKELPLTKWKNVFTETENGTRVEYFLQFDTTEDLEKLIEMGFEEGVTIASNGLEELLAIKMAAPETIKTK